MILGIRFRRGLEADLDPSLLLPGEPAFTTDTRKVLIGNGEGGADRLSTDHDFADFQVKLEDLQTRMESTEEQSGEHTSAISKNADDIEALQSALSDIQDLLDNMVYIVESGENASGEWKKYSDGTMEISHAQTFTANVTNAWGQTWAGGTIRFSDFPVAFVNRPKVVAQIMTVAGEGSDCWLSKYVGGGQASTTNAGAYQLGRGTSASNATITVAYTAEGRWR